MPWATVQKACYQHASGLSANWFDCGSSFLHKFVLCKQIILTFQKAALQAPIVLLSTMPFFSHDFVNDFAFCGCC